MVDGHNKVNSSTIENPSPTFINAKGNVKDFLWYASLICWMLRWWPYGVVKGKRKSLQDL